MASLRDQLQATLNGSYSLERELTGGGMARVFVATESRLRRTVVVKVLSPELAAGVSAERFEREIQVVAQLQQANIVPLLSAGDTNGVPYYTMPFVEGESLRARLAKGPLTLRECVSVLRDIARALSYAHAHGVVHRDIKPDNVLLSHGTAVVTDFGIAKALSAARTEAGESSLTQTGTSIGTPNYMSPEQAAGDPNVDHRADIYAFGCVAYELLAGRPPFVGPTPQRVIAAHLAQAPQSLRALKPDTPEPLASLVMRCLEKSPAERPASADEIMHALDTVVTPTGSSAASAMPRSSARPARLRAMAIGAGALALVVLGTWWALGRSAGTTDTSIAVLPLTNLSADKSNDYLGEGLAEEITGALGKVGLKVIGRGSARALVARGLDAREIASQLGVGSLLQGSVQRSGDRLRITVSLTSASDGAVRWSQKYDRELKDLFAVQDEIARNVAGELRATIAGSANRAFVRAETEDPEAHSLYLQGLYLWNRRTAGTLREAIRFFERAVQRDPNYARAHAGIAQAYVILPIYDEVDADEMITRAREAAERAVAIDSTSAEAHATLGYAATCQFRNAEAAAHFQRAIALDSSYATAHFWYALYLAHMGRFDESLREHVRALALEPASLIIKSAAAQVFFNARRYAEAESVALVAMRLDQGFQIASIWLANALIEDGKVDSAIATIRRTIGLSGVRESEKKGILAYALVRARRGTEATQLLDDLRASNRGALPASPAVAAALDALGQRDQALAVLEEAFARHNQFLMLNSRAAPLDGLRNDPRAARLFARMHAP